MLRKIADIKPPCNHREHNPPSMIVLSPGVYEHTCPGCGHVTAFSAYPGPQCVTDSSRTNVSISSVHLSPSVEISPGAYC